VTDAANIRGASEVTELPYKPKPLEPITDPVALKEATVRDYKRWSATMGGSTPSSSEIESQAIRDLLLVEAYQHGRDLTRAPARVAPRRAERVIDEWSRQRDEDGVRVAPAAPAQRYRPGVLFQRAHARSEKWSFAIGRVNRLLEGASIHADIKVVASTAAHPVLALRFLRAYAAYLMRGHLEARKSRHNPFEGLSDKDASRKFERMVYDICDASHGFAGPWWVPK
jgi:hypothetical protein